MLQTRRDLLEHFLKRIGAFGDDDAAAQAGAMLNVALATVAGAHPWRSLISTDVYTFSTVSGTNRYALPPWFGRVSSVDGRIRNLTNGDELWPTDIDTLNGDYPEMGISGLDTPGRPAQYALGGTMGVHTAPSSSGDALEVLSSSASDTAVVVTVEGKNSSDQWTRTQVTLTGTSPVSIGTWKWVQRVSKAYQTGVDPATAGLSSVGNVTLRKVTGSTELQLLLPDESARELSTIVLHATPDGVYAISVPCLLAVRPLVNDADMVPKGFGPAVLEELTIQWKIDDGEIKVDSQDIPRPALLNLKMQDNADAAQFMRHRKPFGR